MFYHGERFDVSLIGHRVVGQACEQCGREYCYELARIGSGSSWSHYGYKRDHARAKARLRAELDLEKRLSEESELVPCPKCEWISENLISGYRRGRCRWTTPLAIRVVGLGGLVLSILAFGLALGGPLKDVVVYIIGVALVSGVLAAAILLIRPVLRSRIQPNRDFPYPPNLPRCTPQALVWNSTAGAFEPTKPPSTERPRPDGWIEIQIGRERVPGVDCCRCLARAGPDSAYQAQLGRGLALDFPQCPECARVSLGRIRASGLVAAGAAGVLGIPALGFFTFGSYHHYVLAACVVMIFPAIIAGCTVLRLTAPVRVKFVDRSRGVVRIRFRNAEYLNKRGTTDNAQF